MLLTLVTLIMRSMKKPVLDIMKELDMLDIPRLTLYNKADKAEDFTPDLDSLFFDFG